MSQGQCHLQRTVGDTPHELDKNHSEWQNTAANMWRCRGPGGSHRLQNGWGVARRGPRWVRLPYASARNDWLYLLVGLFTHGFADSARLCFPFSPAKLSFPIFTHRI